MKQIRTYLPDIVMASIIWGLGIFLFSAGVPNSSRSLLIVWIYLSYTPLLTGVWIQIRHSSRMIRMTDPHRREHLALTRISAREYIRRNLDRPLMISVMINYSFLPMHWAYIAWSVLREEEGTVDPLVLTAGLLVSFIALAVCAIAVSLAALWEVGIRECRFPGSWWRFLSPIIATITLIVIPQTFKWATGRLLDITSFYWIISFLIAGSSIFIFVFLTLARSRRRTLREIYYRFE